MTRAQVVDGWRIDVTVRPGVPRLLSGVAAARVVAEALTAAGAPKPATLLVVLTDDAELADLNATHLGHDGPTDVLSFPLLPPQAFPPHEGGPLTGGPLGGGVATPPSAAPFVLPPRSRIHLGDIAVSVERARAQAEAGRGGQTGDVGWSPADELRLLLTHGALHLCGWDHAEPVEEAAMRALERRLLGDVPG
ncbi:MAG: rRNA maturation RNase YbeY [Chloroflexi bacterium]|nr:rRNA maturation RNase YbeY [Chloroflexota bacterium]